MASTTVAGRATIAGGAGRNILNANSSNGRYARFLSRQPSSSFRNGQLTNTALRRFRG